MKSRKRSPPEWASKILTVRRRLGLNQSEFAARLNYSAMTLCRWESGSHEPTAQGYIQMGNLSAEPEASWFWTRAGLKSADISRMFPEGAEFFVRRSFPDFEIVVADGARKIANARAKTKLVAVPVLDVHAGSHGLKGDQVLDLHQANVDEMIATPLLWCPNPSATRCLRVRGSSMNPLIYNGDIVAVDCSARRHVRSSTAKLSWPGIERLVLPLSRFLLLKGMQLLESENRDYKPILLGKDRNWRIIGKVLWWIRRIAVTALY